jgi:hypothetical protein
MAMTTARAILVMPDKWNVLRKMGLPANPLLLD